MEKNEFQTRSQKMAQAAYLAVSQRVTKDNEKNNSLSEYRTFARKFPGLIHTSGLMQAFSFAFSKSKGSLEKNGKDKESGATQSNSRFDWYAAYLEDLMWVIENVSPVTSNAKRDKSSSRLKDSLEKIQESHTNEYIRLSRYALDASQWLSRYVEALIAEETESQNSNPESEEKSLHD